MVECFVFLRPLGLRLAQTLLEAVADFASTSLVNARLFRALEETAEAARDGEKMQNALLERVRGEAMREVQAAGYPLSLVLSGTPGSLNDAQRQALQTVQAALRRLTQAAEKTVPSESLTLRS